MLDRLSYGHDSDERAAFFPLISSGVLQRRRTRSRAQPRPTAAARASGTPSAPPRARSGTETRARSRATPTTAMDWTSRACRSSAWTPTAFRSPGRARRARRTRTRQRGRTRLLRPPGRRSACRRHPPVRLALPLGSPQALENAGGWPSRATAEAFGEYVEIVARRLGDRVRDWLTQNEPYCVSRLGYALGLHAPASGPRYPPQSLPRITSFSHGLAVEVLRRESPESEVGIVLDSWPVYPASDDLRDAEAAREADGFRNRLFFDPVLRGTYPATSSRSSAIRRPGSRRRPGRDLGADRLRRAEQLLADDRRSGLPRGGRRTSRTAARRRRWAGRSTRTGSSTSSAGCTASTASRSST